MLVDWYIEFPDKCCNSVIMSSCTAKKDSLLKSSAFVTFMNLLYPPQPSAVSCISSQWFFYELSLITCCLSVCFNGFGQPMSKHQMVEICFAGILMPMLILELWTTLGKVVLKRRKVPTRSHRLRRISNIERERERERAVFCKYEYKMRSPKAERGASQGTLFSYFFLPCLFIGVVLD